MPFFVVPFLLFATALFAVEQEQPTPYDLIRPIWPMTWDTAATDAGGTVEGFSNFIPVLNKHNVLPKIAKPADFTPNGIIPDSLNQAFRDAQNLRIGRIRINQAGYLPEDPEKQFYYVSADKCAEKYQVVDLDGNPVAGPGSLTSTGKSTTSSWTIVAGTDAAQNNKKRYTASAQGPEGTICVGKLVDIGDLPNNIRYRVKILNQYSATFIISDKVYSMVRDATLKFYGINRSGNSESWFHKPSHTKDGAGSFVSGKEAVTGFTAQEGALQGGWYDCGDHLKESQTQAYAFMVLAVMAASNPDRDEDHYAYNMGETVNTDGIPDILREAKHGADFFLRAFRFADGIVDNMAVSVGNFGADHGWWGRPENQDALPTTLTGRGGPHERDIRLGELGSNISGQIAAGLAILSKDYASYDKAFADSCLIVAEKMYDFAKNLKLKEKSLGPGTYDGGKKYVYNTKADGWSSAAYNGNNESHDDLAIAAIALHYATYEKTGKMDYLNDAVEDKTIGVEQESSTGFFNGGWMAWSRDGMRKSSKNTSWANAYTYTLYGFYKMLLRDTETGLKFGIDDKTRLKYAENVALTLATNVSYMSKTGANSISIPNLSNPNGQLSYGDLWYDMQTDQTWIYNRYQAGNIFEVLAYADVAKDLEGKALPQKGVQQWHSTEMKQLGINQLNYMLGVNPWDVSFLLGVGDKNDAHPHHRASNPEGKNMPGAAYKYTPPTGALFGGVTPDEANVWKPSSLSWEDYHLSETCIDATAMFVASSAVAVREEDRNRAPSDITVEVRYVGYDSAIVKTTQDMRGPAMILYSTNETGPFSNPVKDTVNGVAHEFHITGLENGTTYYFKVIAINIRSEAYATKWLVDSTSTPYSFTTLVSPPGDADIQNVKVCNLTSDTAEIMWYTPNGQYESKVYWDTSLVAYDQMTCPVSATGSCDIVGNADVAGIPTSFHYVKIGKLKEKTTYYYCVESNGKVRCKDDNGAPLKFTTPVTSYDFDVSVYQYEFDGMDFLNLNIVNNEDREFDNLELRFYVTARPDEIEAVPGVNNQPGTCPLLVDSDICQAYDEAGFNKPCLNAKGENVDDSLRYYLRHAVPVKLEDTYNAGTGEYDWYIPIPLGGTLVKSSSRMRIDIGFSSGIYQNNMCETLRTPGKKRFLTDGASKDWSWAAHKREVDGADYDGVPGWPKDQGDMEQAPVNPYIAVYRKGEFVSGFSPSYQEMVTKRAHYEITASFDAPFNVSNGSYVEIDSSTSTMYLKGNAYITESGYVTAIWVNGVALTKEQLATAAIYDEITGRYTLNIPAKMKIGTNKIDVTIFAGPNPECTECQENGGCAFVNRNYFVQFSKGDRTASALQLLTQDGNSVVSPAATDGSTKFTIQLKDKDNRNNETVDVWVYNSRTGDSTKMTLNRTNEALGYFSSSLITAKATENSSASTLSFFGGDTIMVKYADSGDEDDRDSVWFYSKPTKPIPQTATITSDECTSANASLEINFSGNQFDGGSIVLDSIKISLDSTVNAAASVSVLEPKATVVGSKATFDLSQELVLTANPKGTVSIYIRENGISSVSTIAITDAIPPRLATITILENEEHANPQDTIKVVYTEPVNIASKQVWPFIIYDGTSEISQASIKVVSATTNDGGKSWQYVIEGNTGGKIVKQDYLAELPITFKVSDMSGNSLSNKCGPVTIVEAVRPVPVQYASITDFTGDGQPDEIYIEFVRQLRLKDHPDTIDIYWGSPSEIVSFAKPETGWKTSSIVFDTLSIAETKLDSANGTWIKGQQIKRCETKIDYVCTQKIDTTAVYDSLGVLVDKYDTTESCFNKEVEDPTKCTIRQDSTFVPKVDTVGIRDSIVMHDVFRISVPAGTLRNKTVGAEGKDKLGSYGIVHPRQGAIDGVFSNNKYPLRDKCPPIILSASWRSLDLSGKQTDILDVEISEPLDTVAQNTDYFERLREGVPGTYFSPKLSSTASATRSSTKSYTLTYKHESPDAFWLTDSIRLVPLIERSYFTDKAGIFPGEETPWVPIVGRVSNAKFKINVVEPANLGNQDNIYAGVKIPNKENFRLSLRDKDGATLVVASGAQKLNKVESVLVPNYGHAGPIFKIEVVLPDVLAKTQNGEQKRTYEVSLAINLYSNTGSYVNSTSFKFNPLDYENYISTANSSLTLYLEWCAPDDYPLSAEGKKIATGPYIARFQAKANGKYTAANPDTDDNRKKITANEFITKTFGFRRVKKK